MIEYLDPYLLGCLLGDGSLHGNLSFANLDEDVLKTVNDKLHLYGYKLVKKASNNPKRLSEYRISPISSIVKANIKYLFKYKNKYYYGNNQFFEILQKDGYNITNHDTLMAVVGMSKKTKHSYLNDRFPNLQTDIICIKVRDSQTSDFVQWLKDNNLRQKFDQKRIPKIYFTLAFEERLALFQGLMDTDGCGSDHKLEFSVSNIGLANDFIVLAESLGYKTSYTCKQPKYFNKKYNEVRYGQISYRIHLNNVANIQPFLCKRKLEMYNKKRIKNKKEDTYE